MFLFDIPMYFDNGDIILHSLGYMFQQTCHQTVFPCHVSGSSLL
jgi:hypothetical protein